ncbi:unnamed protein product [Didymodactylos carnosus]|uniref:Uncharacterized protein n=1 Tax=Didymodactylos carnosus TaxID=1234261 RepID=A0A8S2F611_9BILA|nr:unnamed protein product [Didymodactylos carnosus]CAF4201329.1 unnamed protein product [Didymodactylos carnosus]
MNIEHPDDSVVYADIANYSQFPKEEEVLFDLGVAFQIDAVEYSDVDKLWHVRMSLTDKHTEVVANYLKLREKEIRRTNVIITFGKLLIEMGQYSKSQKYFENLLCIEPNHDHLADIYFNIARSYDNKAEYTEGIDMYTRAYEMYKNAKPPQVLPAAKALNAIGSICRDQGNYEQALDCYRKVLNMFDEQTTSLSEKEVIARCLHSIGRICQEKGDNLYALEYYLLEYYRRALHIFEKTLLGEHQNIARTLNGIGAVYREQGNSVEALKYHERALKIYRKSLPEYHSMTARTLDYISQAYASHGDSKLELEYAVQAMDIFEKALPQTHSDVLKSQQKVANLT